ncbi:MAG: hypothetical protein ABIH42_01750, partial [Planctomycetota bacterium]
ALSSLPSTHGEPSSDQLSILSLTSSRSNASRWRVVLVVSALLSAALRIGIPPILPFPAYYTDTHLYVKTIMIHYTSYDNVTTEQIREAA